MMIEYYFRVGGYRFWIGGFKTAKPHSEIGFHERIVGSVWELANDLMVEEPEAFEHECVTLDDRSFGELIPPEDDAAECPYCEFTPGSKKINMLSTCGTAECPGGIHTCVLSLPLYTCEEGHVFYWLGRFVDLDKNQALRETLRKYDWDV